MKALSTGMTIRRRRAVPSTGIGMVCSGKWRWNGRPRGPGARGGAGATILGEVIGYGLERRRPPHHPSPPDNGEGAQLAMRMCLRTDSLIRPRLNINAHGTSTQQGDVAETQAVKAVFGDRARKLVFNSRSR